MSMITSLFDKQLLIYRLKTTTGSKRSFQSTATVEGALQDKVIEMTSKLGIITSRNWIAYIGIDIDVKPGDQIKYGGRTFYVDEVTPKDYGINQYTEVLLKESDE